MIRRKFRDEDGLKSGVRDGGRIEWIDAGRGIAIGLVVLLHVTEWVGFVWDLPAIVVQLNEALASIRMPLFFFIAGALGAKWRQRDAVSIFNGRLAILLWTFVVWQPVVFAYKYAAGQMLPGQNSEALHEHILRMAVTVVRPNGELWFLWALIIFFLAARFTRRLNDVLQLVLAGLVSATWFAFGRPGLGGENLRNIGDGWDGVFSLYFFFLLGVAFGGLLVKALSSWKIGSLLITIAVWALTELVAHVVADTDWSYPLDFLERLIGLVAGVSLARLLCRIKWLSLIGTRTLPIYLAHSAIIVTVVCAMYSIFGEIDRLPLGLDVLVLVMLAAFAIYTSLLLYRLRSFDRLRWLYQEPGWFHIRKSAAAHRLSDRSL